MWHIWCGVVDLWHQTKAKWQMNECWTAGGLDIHRHLRRPTGALSAASAEPISQVGNVSLLDLSLILYLSSISPCQLSHFFKSQEKQSDSDTVCYSTGGRGGRNARFLVGDQDDSDEEEEEEGGSPKKGYFSDPESEESEDKSKWVFKIQIFLWSNMALRQ